MKGFKSRKFIISLFVFIVSCFFLWFGKISGTEWIYTSCITLLSYNTFNVIDNKNKLP